MERYPAMTQYFEQGEAGAAEQALQDYLDALLSPAPTQAPAPVCAVVAPIPLPRPAAVATPRPFAEPVKALPLPLRLPLPAPVVEPTIAEPEPPVAAPMVVMAPPVAPPVAERPFVTPAEIEREIAIPVVVETPSPPVPVIITAPAEPVSDLDSGPEPADWLANGRPHWAQQAFECLLFNVGGLRLAVPLVELGSIYPLEPDQLTPIFGQAGWFMGLLPTKQGSIRVIDAAQVVMPERYRPELRDGYRYVITLDGSDWGLAADSVADALTLDPDAVRWRSERSKRPWLAGTVVDQMCALIDAGQLNWLFHRQDRRRHRPGPEAR